MRRPVLARASKPRTQAGNTQNEVCLLGLAPRGERARGYTHCVALGAPRSATKMVISPNEPPPMVVRSLHNLPYCIQKPITTNQSCVDPRRAGSVSRLITVQPPQDAFKPFMASLAAGNGWQSVHEHQLTWNATHADFGMPRGIRYLNTPAGHVNAELGVDHAWLPLTRTHTMQDAMQVGLWFHYTRGCSDFAWNVGRTLLVRNKCEAAVRIEQHVHGVAWSTAVARVHRKIYLAAQRESFSHAVHHFSLGRKATFNRSTIWSEADGLEMLDSCARTGLEEAKRNVSVANAVLHHVLSGNAIDYVVAATLAAANNRTRQAPGASLPPPFQLDTVQFTNQCAECDGNVEVWDVRSLQHVDLAPLQEYARRREWRMLHQNNMRVSEGDRHRASTAIRNSSSFASPSLFRRLNGSLCPLSKTWHQCVACAESETEQNCKFGCFDARPSRPMEQRWTLIPNPPGFYGGAWPDPADENIWHMPVAPYLADVLKLAYRWIWAWGVLIGSVPTDPAMSDVEREQEIEKRE